MEDRDKVGRRKVVFLGVQGLELDHPSKNIMIHEREGETEKATRAPFPKN